MIEQQAVVTAIHGTQARVSVHRQAACGSCAQSGGCSTSVLARFFERRGEQLVVDNPIAAEAGDQVVLGIEESAVQVASLVAYLIPILGLVFGAVIGSQLGSEPLSVTLGLLGLIAGLAWTRSLSESAGKQARYRVRILKNRSRPEVPVGAANR